MDEPTRSEQLTEFDHGCPPTLARASKTRNAGQTCTCVNRILTQDSVYGAFTKRLAETAGAMKVADGFEPGAVIGPLIDMNIADAVKMANDTEFGLASYFYSRDIGRIWRGRPCPCLGATGL